MVKREDVYKQIYNKTLERKRDLNKFTSFTFTIYPVSKIETEKYLNFAKSMTVPAINQSVVYLYQPVLNEIYLLDRKSIKSFNLYSLTDFINRTKTVFLLYDPDGLIDPNLVNLYVTDNNTVVFIINKRAATFLSVFCIKGVYHYGRYNTNVNIPIPDNLIRSYLVWTNGKMDWIQYAGSPGNYYLPINAQGKVSVVVISENMKSYKVTPMTNSQYTYVNFPPEVGFVDLPNIFYWKQGEPGFSNPISHTPLYDGFKIHNTATTSLNLNGSSYVNMGNYPGYDDLTIELRVKINEFINHGTIIQRGNGDSYGWGLQTYSENNNGSILFQFKRYDTQVCVKATNLEVGKFYHIAITAKSDGSSPIIYVNSVIQPDATFNHEMLDTDGIELVVGRRSNEDSLYSKINVDYIRIYNRALSHDEIISNYLGNITTTNLVNHWAFDENSGTTVQDSVGGKNGTINGSQGWERISDSGVDRIVVYIKGLDFVEKYEDLRHEYAKYRDYMNEYLSGTLPSFIQNFTPYTPGITSDTWISDFQDKMVIASKDFPNFYKKYLEEIGSIKFTEYPIQNIRPVFTRNSTAIDFDKKVVDINVPRYLNNDSNIKANKFFLENSAIELNDNTSGIVTPIPSTSIGNEFTLEGWFNVFGTGTIDGTSNRIISIFKDSSSSVFAVGINKSGKFEIFYYNNEGNLSTVSVNFPINKYCFYHFGVTYRNSVFKIYINSELVQIVNGTLSTQRSSRTIRIGCHSENASVIPERRVFNGLLSNIRIWTVEKTEEEIKNTFLTSLTSPDPNLLGYYKLNETQGNIIYDYSGNGYNATHFTNVTPYYFNIFNNGIILERSIDNLTIDPLFNNPINNGHSSSTAWSIPYQSTVQTNVSVENGVLHHTGINTVGSNGSIRINTADITLDKTKQTVIQFKIKYITKIGSFGHRLFVSGSVVDDKPSSQMEIEQYLYGTYIDNDGFTYKEYRIPGNTFTGSGNVGRFGLWSGVSQDENIDYYLKEFSVIQYEYGGYFTPVPKSNEVLKIPSANIINPSAGTVEMWVTINNIPSSSENLRLIQTNINNPSSDLLIYLTNDGRLQYAIAGTNSSKGFLTSANTIKPGMLYYVAMAWENGVMYAYLNGVLLGTVTVSSNATAGTEVFLGSNPNGNENLSGIIHEVRFSKVRRSTSEIANAYLTKSNLPVDDNTTHKLSFNKTLNSPRELNHPTTLTTRHDLRNRLIFVDGLNISPSKVVYNQTTKTYTYWFRESDITGNKIIEVDTGMEITPYVEKAKIINTDLSIGPSSRINKDVQVSVYETSDNIQSQSYNQPVFKLLVDHSNNIVYPNNVTKRVIKLDYKTLQEKGVQSEAYGGTILTIVRGIDDHYYMAGDTVNRIVKINKDTLEKINESSEFTGPITLMVQEPNGKLLIVGGDTNTTVKRVNPSNNYAVEATSPVYSGGIFAITLGADGSVYIAGSSSVNRVWKLNKDTLQLEAQSSNYGGDILSLYTGSDGYVYAGGAAYQKLIKLNPSNMSIVAESPSYGNSIYAIAEGKDKSIYIAGAGGKIMKLNPSTLTKDLEVSTFGGDINTITIDSYGYLFVGGQSGIPITKYEPTTLKISTDKKLELMDTSMYSYTIDENVIKFTFDSSKIGKNIHVVTQKYNKVISDGYSYDGLIQNLPTWVSFVPKENIHVFLNKRLLERDRYYLFDPFRYKIVKGDTVIATDLDTNTIDGEIFNAFITSEFEMIEYNVTLTDGTKIITLNDKRFPFSKKYNLVFVDGKLVYPSDIIEIDNYRFSLNVKSINNMCILRKKFYIDDYEKFESITDKWTDYLATLNTNEIESLIGPLYTVSDEENNSRSVYLSQRHLFEVLYHYCMKGRKELTIEDNYNIPDEIPDALLPDGRIPISTMRSGPYPRYPL